ncbi:protein of unknown function [Fodinibius roseus]|uniref:3-keto-alpha-glucoside-1,2-lyase/3-keto-2-hydroxy-glucal hydratase domain-containing protein n=1 Tax=Fodinibius roseus TaxID=1194090 RepID=A0A1M5KCQ4_9BACT|nr:DUF1080 domain-containing protein [Fodinibius roseus]SHG50714.1 protein of unknown function [Fodinibius roseus]
MNKMRLWVIGWVVILITATGFISCQGQRHAAGGDVVSLFNGENLDGWYTFLEDRGRNDDPRDVFTVTDGMLRISGEEWGSLTTEEEYENYHLITEFRWGDQTFEPRKHRARDSGLLFHSVGEDGAYSGKWMHSIEANIIEGGTGDFIVVGDGSDDFAITSPVAPEQQNGSHVYQPDGEPVTINGGRINWFDRDPMWKDTLGFRGADDIERPAGEWNRMEAIVKGDSITVKLNGVVVNEAFDVRPSKGRIQIQSEGAEIFFRKVDMISL